jgi:hypothetical protein
MKFHSEDGAQTEVFGELEHLYIENGTWNYADNGKLTEYVIDFLGLYIFREYDGRSGTCCSLQRL